MTKQLASFDWTLIQSFVAVADCGSLSGAARQMKLSQPTVGRHVHALEDAYGEPLFARAATGMKLTDAGRALLEPARAMWDAAGRVALIAAGNQESLAGVVRVSASMFTAYHQLPDIVARLRRLEPDIQIEIVASDESENLLFREADIAVRMYRPDQLDIVARHIGDLAIGIYASHRYLAERERPQRMEDLLDHDLVGLDRSETIIRGMRDFGYDADRSWFNVRCDNFLVNWQMVRAGCGIGFVQVGVGDSDPEVERLMPDVLIPPLPVWLAAHQAVRRSPRIKRVWDALAQGLAPFVS